MAAELRALMAARKGAMIEAGKQSPPAEQKKSDGWWEEPFLQFLAAAGEDGAALAAPRWEDAAP